MNIIKTLLVLAVIGVISAGAVIYSGIVNVAADEPHSAMVYWMLEQTRENSIAKASKDIKVPNLEDADLLLSGGTDYNFMCASCHLQPGQKESDMSVGLYPSPPNFAVENDEHSHESNNNEDKSAEAKKHFWVIKHGIKASGMPAWGKTHDDKRIWAMVAFIQKLPELTPEQYQILTAVE